MYTSDMPRSLRILAATCTLLWAMAPQLACFLPHTILTESESECCKQMANECGEAKMQLHECCARTVRTEIATEAKTVRRMLPQFEIVATAATFERPGLQLSPDMSGIFDREIHAPPHDLPVPSLALRI